jgi:uncharacterized protein (UPF0261 family)
MDSFPATVVLVGTLDTKGPEYAFVRDRLVELGVRVVLVDAGVLGEPFIAADVTREEVARAAGVDVRDLARTADRSAALDAMARGAGVVVSRLHAEGRLDGVAGLGGTGGSTVVAGAMSGLPIGVPKLVVSTVASGDTRPYIGASDVTMTYSVVDIAGINRVSGRIFANAAAAIAGMASSQPPILDEGRPVVCASMFGVTTPCVARARMRLEELGYEVLVFHQTGIGGRSMEALMEAGLVTAVLDVTTTELCDELVGGVWSAGPERLESAGRLGLPQVVSLGALDMVNVGPASTILERFRGRRLYEHTPAMSLMRTTPQECAALGRVVADKLNAANGPTALFIPLRGVSSMATEGGPFHDPAADAALVSALRDHVDRERVELHELDLEINDPAFADAMAHRLHELCQG